MYICVVKRLGRLAGVIQRVKGIKDSKSVSMTFVDPSKRKSRTNQYPQPHPAA
jgi:hypothetical protein